MEDRTAQSNLHDFVDRFRGIDNIVHNLKGLNPQELETVPAETVKGLIAFGTLMCYTQTQDSTSGEGAAELENAWPKIASLLGYDTPVGVGTETPAEAGAAG